MSRLLPALALCLSPFAWSQEKEPQQIEDFKKVTPTLELLPNGSQLENVQLSRYDEERRPAALLKASLMKVISETQIQADLVDLLVFDSDGSEQLRINMKSADYNHKAGVLNAKEDITISGEKFSAQGKGGVFQLDARRGFLHGPVSTSFLLEPPKKTTMTSPPLPTTASLLLGMASLALAIPEPLTPAQLDTLDELAKPSSRKIQQQVTPTRTKNDEMEELSHLASVEINRFLNEINRYALLSIAAVGDVPVKKPNLPKPDPEGLNITCDAGMYFDSEKGHIVFLKNVVAKEPRFTMKAAKELKVFLEKKPEDPKKKKAEQEKKEDKNKLPSFSGPSDFADLKSIIATGGVEVLAKDKKGKPIKATAATATYDAKTGDIILRGDFPLIQQGKQYLVAKEPGLYLRIFANGDFFTQPGKWEAFANREELEKARK